MKSERRSLSEKKVNHKSCRYVVELLLAITALNTILNESYTKFLPKLVRNNILDATNYFYAFEAIFSFVELLFKLFHSAFKM